MAAPEFWIIAGPNGAGKTTSVQRKPIAGLLPQLRMFNPDDRTLIKLQAAGYRGFADTPADIQLRWFIESAAEVQAELELALARGEAVGIETVLSTEKYLPLVEAVTNGGGATALIYIALSSAEIARERVAARVRRGGHGVPDEKIALRWRRSLDMLPRFAARVAAFWVADNSDSAVGQPLPVLASGKRGRLDFLSEAAFPEMKAALAPLSRPP